MCRRVCAFVWLLRLFVRVFVNVCARFLIVLFEFFLCVWRCGRACVRVCAFSVVGVVYVVFCAFVDDWVLYVCVLVVDVFV